MLTPRRSGITPAGIRPGHGDNKLLDVVLYLRSADLTGLTQFSVPTLVDRYLMVEKREGWLS